MKKHFFSLFAALFLFLGAANAQTAPVTTKPIETLWVSEATHNFGKIVQGTPVTTEFYLKSATPDSLVLERIQAGCGCTTPVYTAGTFGPDEKVKITVGYNAAAMGGFNKPITIFYNGQQKVIFISGEVVQAPTTPAPENKMLSMIKQ